MTLASISVWGCNQDQDLDSEIDLESTESNLVRPNWVPCAKQGQHCAFSDRRRVRYGVAGRYTTRIFSAGVHCDGANFGTSRNKSATCAFDASVVYPAAGGGAAGSSAAAGSGVAGSQAAAGSGAHDGHVAAGSGAAGSPPVYGAAGSAGSDPHSGHVTAGSGGSAAVPGPYIDMSAIPSGDAGKPNAVIVNTSEKPATSDGTGSFRTSCTFSHMAKDDPIVYPGQPGKSHLHAFFGNTGSNANSTQESLRNTGNSTCRGGTANRSSYWVPALIDAQGKPVKPLSIEVYYKSGYGGIPANTIKPFPSGLRMIAGDAKASSAQAHAFWECHGAYNGHPGSIPQCPSNAEAIKMMVEFPQCWDGKNLDSADHKSHMAYPANGKCPSTHPVAIPAITFNTLYPVRDTTGWHLSSDMYDPSKPGGFSGHADWFEAWDPNVAEAFVKNCVNPAVDCHSHLLGDGRAIN